MGLGVASIVYVVLADYGYNNWEYSFPTAAFELSRGVEGAAVDAYLSDQPTPPMYILMLGFVYRILGRPEYFWIAKLPSVAAVVVTTGVGVAIARRHLAISRVSSIAWALFVLTHPMMLMYGTQATANLLPTSLSMVAVLLACEGRKSRHRWPLILAGIALGTAIGAKYNAVYFAPLVALVVARRDEHHSPRRISSACWMLVVASMVTLIWLVIYFERFGIIGARDRTRHQPNLLDVVSWGVGFSKYGAFLGIFIAPLVLVRTRWRHMTPGPLLLGASVGTLYFTVLSEHAPGEMNLGQIGGFLSPAAIRVAETAGVLIFLLWLRAGLIQSSSPLGRTLALGVLVYLALLAFSLPIQRHLLVVLPVAALVMFASGGRGEIRSLGLRRTLSALVLAPWLVVSLAAYSLLRQQGDTAERVAAWLKENGLVEVTSGGIWIHAGRYRVGLPSSVSSHEVIEIRAGYGVPSNAIHTEEMRVLGRLVRTYAVVPVEAGSGG